MDFCTFNDTAVTPLLMSTDEKTMGTVRIPLEGVAYAANLLFGLPNNVYVLWLIMRRRQDKIASDFIPLNQTVAEILLCFSGICYFLVRHLSICFLTRLLQFSAALSLIMRPLVLSFTCLKQYLATVHPVIFLRCKPLRYTVACCCISWLVVIAVSTVGMAFHLQRGVFLMIFFFLIMAFCCFSVLRALKRPGPGEGNRDQHRSNSMKKRASD